MWPPSHILAAREEARRAAREEARRAAREEARRAAREEARRAAREEACRAGTLGTCAVGGVGQESAAPEEEQAVGVDVVDGVEDGTVALDKVADQVLHVLLHRRRE